MDAMDFSVNIRAVTGLADALDLRAHNLTGAADYLQANKDLRYGSGLLNELAQTHERIVVGLDTFLRHTGNDYAERYALAVGRAVHAYMTTDVAASARVDATLPGVIDPTDPPRLADQTLGPQIFDDPFCLTLATPPDYRSQYPYEPHFYDMFSPSSLARDIIWYGTGVLAEFAVIPEQVDPFEAFTAPLCGDVAGLKKMSFVLCGVATAIGYVSDRIDVEADVMDRVWSGHAASGCRSALLRFARDLRPAVDLVVKLAEEYDRVAEAARANREVMDMALTLMLDEAMTLGLDDAVELGSIALLDMPRLARIGARIWELIVKAKEMIALLHLTIEAANAQMSDAIVQLGMLTVPSFAINLPDDLPVVPGAAHR